MVRRVTIAAATALTALAGCGEGGEEAGMPRDFALTFEHYDATTAPPYHREWTIELGADGDGTIAYVPGYGGDGTPVYRAAFRAAESDVEALHADLAGAGLLDEDFGEPGPGPDGGETERARITADGETTEVPAYDDSGAAPMAPFADRIEALVPARTWNRFEARADAFWERESEGASASP